MSISDLHIIATVGAFIAFISIAWWTYSPSNKKRFEEDAQLALDDDMLGSSASNSRNNDKR